MSLCSNIKRPNSHLEIISSQSQATALESLNPTPSLPLLHWCLVSLGGCRYVTGSPTPWWRRGCNTVRHMTWLRCLGGSQGVGDRRELCLSQWLFTSGPSSNSATTLVLHIGGRAWSGSFTCLLKKVGSILIDLLLALLVCGIHHHQSLFVVYCLTCQHDTQHVLPLYLERCAKSYNADSCCYWLSCFVVSSLNCTLVDRFSFLLNTIIAWLTLNGNWEAEYCALSKDNPISLLYIL